MNGPTLTAGIDAVNAVEVAERLDWQAMRAGQAATVTIDTATLSFLPNGPHQVAAMANLGAELLQEIQAYRPQFLFKSSPAEIVGALIEEMAPPATAASPVRAVAERASTGPTDCDMIDFLELTGSVQWDLENCTIGDADLFLDWFTSLTPSFHDTRSGSDSQESS